MRNWWVSFAAVWLVWSPVARANLVNNPGFEEPPTKAGFPGGGWWLYEAGGSPVVQTDQSVARSGKASVSLRGEGKSRFTLVSSRFTVSPGDEIQFRAWLRRDPQAPPANPGYAGLAFRNAESRVFARTYFVTNAVAGEWVAVAGEVIAPEAAVSAEVHLGYTNACGPVWFDDVEVTIASPVSLALAEEPKPWPGVQDLGVRVINRQEAAFAGRIEARLNSASNSVSLRLNPGETRVVKVPISVPRPGQHRYELRLLGESGELRRKLAGGFRTLAPMTLFPACPGYHHVGEGEGTTRIDARIVENPAQRAGMKLQIELLDATGQVLQTTTTAADQGEWAGVELRIPIAQPASFRIRARLKDHLGKELAHDATEVVVAERGSSQVKLGSDGFLRVNGKPQFPIGLYSAGQFESLASAGFTAVHSYAITTGEADERINSTDLRLKELLDRAARNGLRMMVELPRKAIEQASWQQVRRRIETFRNHPGLLCWGSEERVARGEAPLTNIATLYQLLRQLDPNHPLVLGDTRDVITKLQQDRRNFFPDDCMDIGIWWWYPIPLNTADGNGLVGNENEGDLLQPPSWLTTTLSKKPLWIAIQSYEKPQRGARFPTPAEYRCLAYLSILNGAKGLWFYTGSGQRDWQGKPAGLLNKPQEGHWDYVQQMVRELRELEPVILGKVSTNVIKMDPPTAPVEYALRETDDGLFLLAANKSTRAQTVRFTCPAFANRRLAVLFAKHAAGLNGDAIRAEFVPLGVQVYRVY